MKSKICFIGGGNMASSLLGGLINNGYPAGLITVPVPDQGKLDLLAQQFPINTTTDNQAAVQDVDVIVLAVKPQILAAVCKNIHQALQGKSALIISIAAGIRSTDIDRWLGGNNAIVRCMPNTPSLIQAGATGLFANPQTSPRQKELAEQILGAAGITLWVDEEPLLDAVTAVSGSGLAYFFLFMEAVQTSRQSTRSG